MRPVTITNEMRGEGLAQWETQEYSIKDPPFQAVGDGVTDDTAAIQKALNYLNLIGGGLLFFPRGTYIVSSDLNCAAFTSPIHIVAYEATLQRAATVNQYDMIQPGSNCLIEGLTLQGYVDSGSDHTDVVPQNSFGFRFNTGVSNVTLYRCTVNNIPFDGYFIEDCERIVLQECNGGLTSECYRNTVAVAPSNGETVENVTILGGKFNKAKLRPAIDLEPSGSGEMGLVWIGGGVHCTGVIDILATESTVVLDGVIIDGASYYLNGYVYKQLDLANVKFLNGAYIKNLGGQDQGGTPTGAASFVSESMLRLGNVEGLALDPGENLLTSSYNSIDGWTYNSGGGGASTITPNVPIGPHGGGYDIDTNNKSGYYTQIVTGIEGDAYYSLGSFCERIVGTFGTVIVQELDALSALLTYRVFVGGDNRQWNTIIRTHTDTTQFKIAWGVHTTSGAHQSKFNSIYLIKGLIDHWLPNPREKEAPTWSAAPTSGTWIQGDRVLDRTPSASGNIGWVCTAGGTPGTWKSYGSISA